MAFLTTDQLRERGFRSLGRNVKISDKASIFNPELMVIGDHTRIDDFCVISGKVTLGRNVHIAVYCNIGGGTEGVSMGDFSGLAYACHVFSQSDDYSGSTLTNPTVPAKYKKEVKAAVSIGRHCIIGTGTVIFPGVAIAEGTSVGAASMVTKSTESWAVYFGVPAKRLKSRKRDLLQLEKEYLAEEANGGPSVVEIANAQGGEMMMTVKAIGRVKIDSEGFEDVEWARQAGSSPITDGMVIYAVVPS
jgi:acetyltransferase-like isoleucine patch superfamily enzyme